MASIKYPRGFDEQAKLFKLIYEKHIADGDNSPLKDYNLQDMNQQTERALESDKKAKELSRLSLEKTEERRITFDVVEEDVRAIGAFLKAKFRNSPKELGKWGFTVVGE